MKLLHIILIIFLLCSVSFAQKSSDTYYDVLDNTFRQNSNKSSIPFLIDEFKEYLLLFPNSKQEDEALFSLSQLYKSANNIPGQLFSLIKLRIIHPRSPLSKKAYQIIDSVIVYNNALRLSAANEAAIKEISNMTPAVNHQQACIELISFLHFAQIKVFEALLIEEIRTYKIIYGRLTENLDALNYWQASAYKRKGEPDAALFYYQKLTEVFNHSKFIAPSLMQMSEIYSSKGQKDKAANCLIELINQYPDAPETGDAQFELAQLYHHHYKDLSEALTNYKMLAQVFPENRNYNAALFNAAKISEETGDFQDALNSYMMIVENNTVNEETMVALKNILRIHRDVLKNYTQAAQDYILITQMFPKDKNAARYLLSAARLYKEKANNSQKAADILEIILKNYKDSPQAKEAEALLKQQ